MEKMILHVFDPQLECSCGSCDTSINPELERFNNDLEWLKTQNVEVERYSPINNPDAFANQETVRKVLFEEGNKCLPILLVNGCIVSKGRYPSREELTGFLGIGTVDLNLFPENEGTVSEKMKQEPSNSQKKTIQENISACGPECGCKKPVGSSRVKVVVFLLVLLAICIILAYKVNTEKQGPPVDTGLAFAATIANKVDKPDSTSNSTSTVPSDTSSLAETVKDKQDPAVSIPSEEKQNPDTKPVEDTPKIGEILDSMNSLNKVALKQDAVFIYIPDMGKGTLKKETEKAIKSAEKQLKSKGIRLGIYTLKVGSSDYSSIKAQLPLPAMLVLTKGKGMGTVTGDITETKILQAYVASTRGGGGGCCPSSGGKSSPSCK